MKVDLCVLAETEEEANQMREKYSQYFNRVMISTEPVSDFAKARNKLRTQSDADYVMFLDVDEELPLDFLNHICKIIEEKPTLCYRFPRLNLPDYSGYPDYQVRLFKREDCLWHRPVHEIVREILYLPSQNIMGKPADQVDCITLNYPIMHYAGTLHKRVGRFYRNMYILFKGNFPREEILKELDYFYYEVTSRYEDQQPKKERVIKRLKSIVLFLTHMCNFKCPYCEVGPRYREVEDARTWLKALNSLEPCTIDFTGGEPSLHPAFYDIIYGLKSEHKIGITTNLSVLDIDKLPDREMSITVSLHPSQYSNSFSLHQFMLKAYVLKALYRNVSVNYVAHSSQIKDIPIYHDLFRDKEVRFHIDPDQNREEYSPEEKEFLRKYVNDDRILGRSEFKRFPRLCTAGMEHIHILPDGSIKRCYYNNECLGNIFTEYKLHDSPQLCNPNYCGGCDMDKVRWEEKI